ncbi:MAG: NUDIX hydrolase [Chroococcales cyanobacterium]
MKRLWHFTQAVLGIVFRHPVLGISIIPLLDNGQIVLIRRRDNGKWGLPGGMVDWGEDIPNTLKRELTEETGLSVTQVGRLVGIYSAPDRDPRIHSICVVVVAQVQGEMKIYDPAEILEVKAFDRDSLPLGQLSHDHDRQLQDFLNGVTTVA